MKYTKKNIQEIIDNSGNLIGTKDMPQTGSNKETEAPKTTDYNAKVHGQNYKNDFLGRFGFYFYEAEQHEQPPVVVDLMNELGSEEIAWKIMNIIRPHLEKTLDEMDSNINEATVIKDNKKVKDTLAKMMYEKFKETLNHYYKNPDKLEKDWKLHQRVDFKSQPEGSREHDYEWASDILKVLESHIKKDINEVKVIEDKLVANKDKKSLNKNKKGNDELKKADKIEKVADLLNKLEKNDLNKLMTLLEQKRKSEIK